MGLFAAPNRAGIMNSLPPDERGAGGGMATTFQNAAQVLSIGIYFSLVVIGLTARLPQSLLAGLTSHGVPQATAESVAHLPPVGILFAAFLGFNPISSLLGPSGVLGRLSSTNRAALLGHGFFAHLISQPFADGLHTAFYFSLAVCLVAAVASWMRGAKYHYAAAPAREAVAPAFFPTTVEIPSLLNADASISNGASARERPTVQPGALAAELAHWRERALGAPGPLVVAISATYGAKGGVVGPMLAERLGLPFIDRAIPAAVAAELAIPLDAALAHDDRSSYGFARVLASMSQAETPYGAQRLEVSDAEGDAELLKMTAELVLWRLAATTGGVVLGRASALVLAEYPHVFRVRLDGPVEDRIAWAMAFEHLDEAAARRAQRETDRVHAAYVRYLYGTAMTDPSHFDLYVDTAAIEPEACVDLLEEWVRDRALLGANSSRTGRYPKEASNGSTA
jgi:cytidylate kinase